MREDLRVNLSIRIFTDRKCFGPGIAALLHRVDELHSLRAAAQSMEMAYSKAWKIVKNGEEGLGIRLLSSTTGGKNGGGAVLTEEARALLENYDAYCQELRALAEQKFAERFPVRMEAASKD